MADAIITKQELIDAQKDAQTLEDAVNGEPGKLIKSRTGREFYSLASVPQINTMTREEVAAAVAPKANRADVETALSNLSTTANKYYSTLAAANADIANIALNQSVTIGEESNSGLWEKKTAGATTLTRSAYDPLTQAVKIANEFTNSQSGYYKTENIVNPNQSVQQGYFGIDGIITAPQFPTYYIGLDYYEARAGQKFWLKGVSSEGSNDALIQSYDIDKNIVSTYTYKNIVKNSILTVPNSENISFIRIGTNNGQYAFLGGVVQIGVGDILPDLSLAFNESYSLLKNKDFSYAVSSEVVESAQFDQALDQALAHIVQKPPLADKKWVAMGDSITNSLVSYANVLSIRHGATLIKHTQDGARVHRASSDPSWNFLVLAEEYLNIPIDTNPDLITIAGGTNDEYSVENMGNFGDRTVDTFYGALHVLIYGLLKRFPNARIGFIAPIPQKWDRFDAEQPADKVVAKWLAIKRVCEYHSVQCWNGNTEFGASPTNSETWMQTYMPDGLHPSELGHIWYANRVEDFVLNLAK